MRKMNEEFYFLNWSKFWGEWVCWRVWPVHCVNSALGDFVNTSSVLPEWELKRLLLNYLLQMILKLLLLWSRVAKSSTTTKLGCFLSFFSGDKYMVGHAVFYVQQTILSTFLDKKSLFWITIFKIHGSQSCFFSERGQKGWSCITLYVLGFG